MMEKEQRPAVEVVLTVLHAGGKFGQGGGYKVSGGLHGVGVSVVNALSERLDVEVKRDGFAWTQSYKRGTPLGDLKKGEPTKETGTTITFLPDADVFETLDFDFTTLEERLRDTAFLTRGLRIKIKDNRGEGHEREFKYDGGIVDFVGYLNRNKEPIHKKVISFEARARRASSRSRCSGTPLTRSRSSRSPTTSTRSRAASHLSGFRSALTGVLNKYALDKGLLKEKDDRLTGGGRPRGSHRGHLGEAHRSAVRGSDEDQARQPGHGGVRPVDRERAAVGVPRGEPARRERCDPQGGPGGAGALGCPQGTRPDAAQVRAREFDAAGQAERLLGQGPQPRRTVRRRG